MREVRAFAAFAATLACVAFARVATKAVEPAGIGTPATPAQTRAWTTEILPDGTGLPAGRGSVARGEVVFESRCESCHATPAAPALSGGVGSLARVPQKSVTSYWPSAPTLFDYIRRAMPPGNPASLSANDVYAVCAFVLAQDGLVRRGAVLDRTSLPRVLMPNRDGFVPASDADARGPTPASPAATTVPTNAP